ncbi:uroporphyrinogen-III synthase [Alkalilimnicola ehrlichii MLHE-1]|uniref:Uroporphyrinogen III synthase HEM4 n=1 Tax=Alkalilimnicola ehrlichii (strain ATCC BAA-1101 / DSM 17681 / MLHE-1) TaxID=187272 RepID=Q0A7Y4_ALKEH|nr:uroporphyrinogen-III synthase [Alkalilimnicola ehrlichii]ABI57053.1 Uroporphyrinogen III synthase HEM4 [Alkalilimnicola ehrlichii MLHE-1]
MSERIDRNALADSLAGRHVAIPESRQLEVLAGLLERRGARVWRCPLVGIHDVANPAPVDDWLRDFVADPPDLLILLTGEGLRRLLSRCEAIGLRDAFLNALSGTSVLCRGPKPARVLQELALTPDRMAVEATTEGVIRTLNGDELQGRRVAVQLYGTNPNQRLMDYLKKAGAHTTTVAPYVYADEAEDDEVRQLVVALGEGRLDALILTSSPQVQRLLQVAKAGNLEELLRDGLRQCTVAAIGPVVARALRERALPVDLMPEHRWFMKPLVQALAKHLGPA